MGRIDHPLAGAAAANAARIRPDTPSAILRLQIVLCGRQLAGMSRHLTPLWIAKMMTRIVLRSFMHGTPCTTGQNVDT